MFHTGMLSGKVPGLRIITPCMGCPKIQFINTSGIS